MTLLILTLVNLLNYIDRYVISALVETLKHSELALSDAQAGLLMTSFIFVYTFVSPYFGYIGDRFSRPKTLAAAIVLWSVATALGGLATGFITLLASRALIGVGEAAYVNISPTLLADSYPAKIRARVMSVFYSAIPIGSALGYLLGGFMDHRYGWRSAFFVAGAPGLVLALLTLRLPDRPRGGMDEIRYADIHPRENRGTADVLAAEAGPVRSLWLSAKILFRDRRYLLASLGYAAYTFGLGGMAFWMPAYLERVREVAKVDAALQAGGSVVVTGFIGTFLGGFLGDFFHKKSRSAHLWVCAGATLLAVPCLMISLASSSIVSFWAAMAFAQTLLFVSTGPLNSALVEMVNPARRAIGLSICNFVTHVLGDLPSPTLIGWVSDRSSLRAAVYLVPVSILMAGVLWTMAAGGRGSRGGREG